jgi:hypothetical protein
VYEIQSNQRRVVARSAYCFGDRYCKNKQERTVKTRKEAKRPINKMAVLLILFYAIIVVDVFAYSASTGWLNRIQNYACPLLMVRFSLSKPGGYFMHQYV